MADLGIGGTKLLTGRAVDVETCKVPVEVERSKTVVARKTVWLYE